MDDQTRRALLRLGVAVHELPMYDVDAGDEGGADDEDEDEDADEGDLDLEELDDQAGDDDGEQYSEDDEDDDEVTTYRLAATYNDEDEEDEEDGKVGYLGNNNYVGPEPDVAAYWDPDKQEMRTAQYVADMLEYHTGDPDGDGSPLAAGTRARAEMNAAVQEAIERRAILEQQVLAHRRAQILANISGAASLMAGLRDTADLPVYTSTPAPRMPAERYHEPRHTEPLIRRPMGGYAGPASATYRVGLPGRPYKG